MSKATHHFCSITILMLATTTSLAKESSTGTQVANFELQSHRGKVSSLDDFAESKFVVVAFLGTECPLAKLYGPRLAELHKEFAGKGVAFIGINANTQDSLTEITAYVARHKIPFAMLKDVGNRVADQIGAKRTPEVFVLDKERKIRYHGRIDDQYGVGFSRDKVDRRDLAIALEELIAGNEVTIPETEAIGCHIGRVSQLEPHGDITYSNQIVRIFNKRCVECHRDGEIAPFTLTSYEDTIGWEDTILEVIADNRMPPWFAHPSHGEFSNDSRLSKEEKALIRQWVENGMPEGDKADLPEPPRFARGWKIPKTDQVVYMQDEPFDVPAEGVVDYQYFTVDPQWDEDKYIYATEARPDNPSVVHHIIVYVQPPGEVDSRRRRMLVGFAPGSTPKVLRDGIAMYVPAGSKLIFEMHYTPNGTKQLDRSYVGFRFMDKADVKKQLRGRLAINTRLDIPAHDGNHIVKASYESSSDELLLSMTPHMHLRGKSFRYEAFFPDGSNEVLLDVPTYDFNWQLSYELAEPKLLPKGTRILCTAAFDNSADNPVNPDPSKRIHWGDQSFEEMMIGFFNVVTPDQKKTVAVSKASIDPTGVWTWKRGETDEFLTLKLDGDKLSGTLKSSGRETPIEQASIQDDHLCFQFVIPEFGDLIINFDAKVEQDKLEGNVNFTVESVGKTQKLPWLATRFTEENR